MMCLWVFGILHRSEDARSALLVPKQARTAGRLLAAAALIAVTQSDTGLSTTALLVVEMSIIVAVVLWETIGGMHRQFKIFESWHERNGPVEVVELGGGMDK